MQGTVEGEAGSREPTKQEQEARGCAHVDGL